MNSKSAKHRKSDSPKRTSWPQSPAPRCFSGNWISMFCCHIKFQCHIKKKYVFAENVIFPINKLSLLVWWFPMIFYGQSHLFKPDYISLFGNNICSNLIVFLFFTKTFLWFQNISVKHSALRSLMLLLALSFHGVFEVIIKSSSS